MAFSNPIPQLIFARIAGLQPVGVRQAVLGRVYQNVKAYYTLLIERRITGLSGLLVLVEPPVMDGQVPCTMILEIRWVVQCAEAFVLFSAEVAAVCQLIEKITLG